MDLMLCVSDLEATVRDHPKSAALEHLLQVLEPDMELQISPPQASWASGLVVDEQAQLQQLSIGASSDTHEG